jgi:hypothetical protein
VIRGTWLLLAVCGALCVGGANARADVIDTSGSVTITGNDDPGSGSFSSTVSLASLLAGPTAIDGGQLLASATITPVSSSSAWLQFDFETTNPEFRPPLAGTPGGNWGITVSGIQTTNPAALTAFFNFFAGTSTLFPFGGTTFFTNPITGSGTVDGAFFSPPFSFSTSQSLFAFIDPFNQGGVFDSSPDTTPNGFSIAGQYTLQFAPPPPPSVPEPSTLAMLTFSVMGLAAWRWRQRSSAAPIS